MYIERFKYWNIEAGRWVEKERIYDGEWLDSDLIHLIEMLISNNVATLLDEDSCS